MKIWRTTRNVMQRTALKAALLVFVLIELASVVHGQALRPTAPVIKPQHTVVAEGFAHDRIAVKFKDGLHVRLRNDQLSDEGTGALANAASLAALASVADGRWLRTYPIDEVRLEQMRQTAQRNLGRAIADLNLQYELVLPAGADAAAAIDQFNALDIVELAQPVPLAVPSPVPPNFQPNQVYLNPAPPGVDAVNVWSVSGVTGGGVRVVDVEYSWNYSHQDLPPVTHLGQPPMDPFSDTNHGTAVLGEMASLNNGWGTTGIAHGAQFFTAAANTSFGYNVGGAILVALQALSPGDIILIEQQTSGPNGGQYVPVEWNVTSYNAIVTAVGNGVIVVEAAGNGNQNLDTPIFSTGNGGHWPFLPQNDSGAIIVGAGAAPSPLGSSTDRSRLGFSTYGSTVDLQGWGESVFTSGYGGAYAAEGFNLLYTGGFSGTSSASPIVAGACALLQSKYKSAFGAVLTPAQVRDTLRVTGSPQQNGANPATQNIGPRPNVSAAIATFVPPPPLNNVCANASVAPPGATSFTTISATTDGPDEPAGCGFAGGGPTGAQITNDVWFKHVATCTGTYTVSLCAPGGGGGGGADFDARMAVYIGCPSAPGQAIACNDDFCGSSSQLTFHNAGTNLYRIRIGGSGDVSGTGTLTITCQPDPPSCLTDIAPPGTGDGEVNIDDLLLVVNSWGLTGAPGTLEADIAPDGGDGQVNIDDLLAIVNTWGVCP